MKIVNSRLGLEVEFLENQVLNLTLESPGYFAKMVYSIGKQIDGEEGELIISDSEKEISLEKKAIIITNPLMVNCNEKKILTQLYKNLSEKIVQDYSMEFAKINQQIITFMELLANSSEYNLTMDVDLQALGLVKYCNVYVDTYYDNLAEKFIDYLRAMKTICKIDIVFVLNIKQYFNTSELEEIYKYCFYMKIYLINLEGIKSNPIKQDKYIIIAKDLCILEILY